MSKRKYVRYVTDERLSKVNKKNLDLWKRYLNGKRNLSDATREQYTYDFRQFLVYVMLNYDNQFLFDVEAEDMADILDDFVAMCTSVFENNDRRLGRRLSTISSMYLYYKKKRKIKENPLDYIERPTAVKGQYIIKQTFLTKEQVEEIREYLNKANDTQLELFFELGLYSMARVNALSSIRVEQIDLEKKRIDGVIEKEGYEVTLMFNNRCKELIERLLKEREESGIETELLFVNRNGSNAKETMQTSWIKKIGKSIGVSELHCHDLRHSGSNLRFQSGMSLESVSKALNHKGTQVTQDHYLQMNFDKLQDEMEEFDV